MAAFNRNKWPDSFRNEWPLSPKYAVLAELGEKVLVSRSKDEIFNILHEQAEVFYQVYNKNIAKLVYEKNYKKVAGYCVCYYLPSFIGNPVVINPIGFAFFIVLNFKLGVGATDLDPEKKIVFERMTQELEFGDKMKGS